MTEVSGSGSGLEKIMDPDSVCPDPVNIHLNLKQDIFLQMYPCFYLFVDNKKFSFQRPICSLENLISLIPLRHYTTLLILQSAEI